MKGKIVLDTGDVFEGNIVCGKSTVTGKLVFDTRVVGYEKVLTSPEYRGMIVCFTYPLIGNYGICREDAESESVYPSGIIMSEYSGIYSNFRAECSLKEFLKETSVTVIEGVDTQNITQRIRENRELSAAVAPASAGLDTILKQISDSKNGKTIRAAAKCSGEKTHAAKKNSPYIAAVDLGLKKSERLMLRISGLDIEEVFPDSRKAGEVIGSAAGVYVSSGSEDMPAVNKAAGLIKTVLGRIPVLACGTGHLAAGLACGGEVFPDTVNHYGVNQPVMNTKEKKCRITEQAHRFILDAGMVSGITAFVNVNDGTVEGLEDRKRKVMTTAFLPEEKDFKKFFDMIKE